MISLACSLAIAAAFGAGAGSVSAGKVTAASVKAKNAKAHKAYKKKMSSIAKASMDCSYKYVDITGDGIHEALVSANVGRDFYIFTYKGGKAKKILTGGDYGLSKITIYKGSKGIITYGGGHGGETYSYYKKKGSSYKKVASRSRQSVNGGGMSNGPWYYYNGKSGSINKAAFNKNIKGISKGKKSTINTINWKMVR